MEASVPARKVEVSTDAIEQVRAKTPARILAGARENLTGPKLS